MSLPQRYTIFAMVKQQNASVLLSIPLKLNIMSSCIYECDKLLKSNLHNATLLQSLIGQKLKKKYLDNVNNNSLT